MVIDFQKSLTLTGGGGGGAIVVYKNTTIKSSTSDLVTLSAGNTGINAIEGASVTLDGVNLKISKPSFGITAKQTASTLTIKSSTVEIESTSVGIQKFGSITFDNCHIESPEGGKVKDGYVVDASGNYAKNVKIALGASAIDAVEIDSNAEVNAIYDAAGRQTTTAKRGLNIVRMSDGTVRKVMVK